MSKTPALPQRGGSFIRDAKGGLKPVTADTPKDGGKAPSKEG